MADRYEIKCINKTDRFNPHERIQYVGIADGFQFIRKISQQQVISCIELNGDEFFVRFGGFEVKVVIAESAYGNKYLRTEADRYDENNLLSLPECL